jgi:hypothetical protein
MKPVKISQGFNGSLPKMKSLELSLKQNKRTINESQILLFPELNFKIPYHEIDGKFYLTGGLCGLSVVYKDKEYYANFSPMFNLYDSPRCGGYYEKFKEKFDIKSNYIYCYSAELHECVMEFEDLNSLKNWFGNNFFYSHWRHIDYKWERYENFDEDFYKFITSYFRSP